MSRVIYAIDIETNVIMDAFTVIKTQSSYPLKLFSIHDILLGVMVVSKCANRRYIVGSVIVS